MGTWRSARAEQGDITEDEAREALLQLDPLWEELIPAEQARIVRPPRIGLFQWLIVGCVRVVRRFASDVLQGRRERPSWPAESPHSQRSRRRPSIPVRPEGR